MSFQIIDNKKVDMTADEYATYQRIVEAYTKPPYQKGEDFFIDLFEVDDNGIIIFLKPPSQRQVSLEIFLFIVSVMNHQHLRCMREEVSSICKQMREKMDILDQISNNYVDNK